MTRPMINITNLRKAYGDFLAVDDISFAVQPGEIFGLLGPNGTTIILATHDMAEAEQLSDRVAILLNGRFAASGNPLEITATGAGLTKVSVPTKANRLLHSQPTFPSDFNPWASV